jgi:hypothetical protein
MTADHKLTGELWSLLRYVLHQGAAIAHDFKDEPYETYVRRMDLAARERVDELLALLAKETP